MTIARPFLTLLLVASLPGCAPAPDTTPWPDPGPGVTAALIAVPPDRLPVKTAARNFTEVVARVEPLAESICRRLTEHRPTERRLTERRLAERSPTPENPPPDGLNPRIPNPRIPTPTRNCDFQIGVDMTLTQPPNAYQTTDAAGRPQIVFTIALIAGARNSDELAFVLGHEASHHILGHLDQTRQEALNGAILGGILASVTGADASAIERAQQRGAQIGALRFSKAHELEADQLGTLIAARAGYDPLLGAQFFTRLPDPGAGFLNSHPANARRQAVVAATYAQISAQ